MRAEIWPAPDGWRWRALGGNNEILATGESYVRKIDAEGVVRLLFDWPAAPVEVTVRDHGGQVAKHYTLRQTKTAPTSDRLEP